MTEFKLTIEAPDIADALRTLAGAIQLRGNADVENVKTAKVEANIPTAVNPIQVPPVAVQTAPPVQVTSAAVPAPVVTQAAHSAQSPSNPPLTLEMLSNAGAGLLEKGMMPQLMALLGKYGVQAITLLKPEQFPAFAAELRAMGAAI